MLYTTTMLVSTLWLLSLSASTTVRAVDEEFERTPLPATLDLIYPTSSVDQYNYVGIGESYFNSTPNIYGVLLYIEHVLTHPNGTEKTLLSVGDPPWSGVQAELRNRCHAVWANVSQATVVGPLNNTGTYSARWVITWSYPEYVDPTNPAMCNGSIVSRQRLEERRSFEVVGANDGSMNVSTASFSPTRVQLNPTPTGSGYAERTATDGGVVSGGGRYVPSGVYILCLSLSAMCLLSF